MNVDAARASDTSTRLYSTTRCHNVEDCICNSHSSENLKSDTCLWNVSKIPPDYMVSHPRKRDFIFVNRISCKCWYDWMNLICNISFNSSESGTNILLSMGIRTDLVGKKMKCYVRRRRPRGRITLKSPRGLTYRKHSLFSLYMFIVYIFVSYYIFFLPTCLKMFIFFFFFFSLAGFYFLECSVTWCILDEHEVSWNL